MKKRILLDFGVPFRFTKTGIYNYNMALKKYLANYYNEFDIFYLDDVYPFSNVYGFIGKLIYVLWINFFLPFYVKKYQIDLVHFTNYLTPFTYLPTKIVVTIQDLRSMSNDVRERKLSSLYRFYRRIIVLNSLIKAYKVIAISQYTKTDLLKCFGNKYIDKIEVIHMGVNPINKINNYNVEKSYPKLNNLRDSGYIIMPGPLTFRKNHIDAVEMFCKHKRFFLNRNMRLVIIGDGPMRELLHSRIKQDSLEENILMTGYISEDELDYLYRYASIGLFLSSYEGFGLPLLEMLLRDIPVIASDTSSIKEASGNIAYYVKVHDIEGIFNYIQYILDVKNKVEVSARKRLGVEFALQHTWQVTVSKTANLYKSCIGNRE